MPTTDSPLTRIDNVELIRAGQWQISTGTWDAAPEDLAAAVAATACPAIRRPVIKLGHIDPRFDGEPAIGWVENLRLADGGYTLTGDLAGVPAWLKTIAASAYPDRSVEGRYNFKCQLGHTHPFVLTGLALLGVTPPGVGTLRSLQDIPDLFGIAASNDEGNGVLVRATIRAAAEVHTGAMVALLPSDADAQRLAVDGGEPADQLHVTLAYLGTADDLTPAMRQDVIDKVSEALNGMPYVDADAFAVSVFNPGRADRDTCIVLGLSGADLDVVHDLVTDSLDGLDLPEQHDPWIPHLTLRYTTDLSQVAALADRTGPIRFDRVRIAFAGQTIDIPLLADVDDEDEAELLAAAGDEDNLRNYWVFGKGRAKWRRWTELYRRIRKFVGSERAKRIAAAWFHLRYGYWPGDKRNRGVHASDGKGAGMPNPQPTRDELIRAAWNTTRPVEQWIVEIADGDLTVVDDATRTYYRVPVTVAGTDVTFGEPTPLAQRTVFASRDESRPPLPTTGDTPVVDEPSDPPDGQQPDDPQPTPPDPGGVSVPPAAEPDPTDVKEERVSDDIRSLLGVPDDADDTAVVAAIQELKTKADTAPDPDRVAAAAAVNEQLTEKVNQLTEQVQQMGEQLAAANVEKAATVKASVLDTAQKEGKFRPADRGTWEARYDRAPEVTAEVLASIPAGTAVPVQASGYTGSDDAASIDDEYEALVAAIDGPTAKGGN